MPALTSTVHSRNEPHALARARARAPAPAPNPPVCALRACGGFFRLRRGTSVQAVSYISAPKIFLPPFVLPLRPLRLCGGFHPQKRGKLRLKIFR
jgi:hypothetical protein